MTSKAQQAAEQAAREAYGRLLSTLCQSTRDVAAAEDALGDAFARALAVWPTDGVPEAPDAWLLTTARRRVIDQARRRTVAERHADEAAQWLQNAGPDDAVDGHSASTSQKGDARLDLMLACAHPDIDAAVHAPLMLQTVLGLPVRQIAAAFALSPAALGQRLARAKRRMKDLDLSLEPADVIDADALSVLLNALYAAFATGWNDAVGVRDLRHGLANEALWLARVVVDRCPDAPEALGLLALMLFAQSRRAARRDAAGRFVPLADQDRSLWDTAMMREAEAVLGVAARGGRMGRFQIEAAIQARHARPPVDADDIALLYEGLVRLAPSRACLIARAAALAEARGVAVGLSALAQLDPASVDRDASYWSVLGHLKSRAGLPDDARLAWRRAVGLAADPAIRAYLKERIDAL
ncbi:MAG: DUF6596 domain-containing protein [Pseudomonadota bacterium]